MRYTSGMGTTASGRSTWGTPPKPPSRHSRGRSSATGLDSLLLGIRRVPEGEPMKPSKSAQIREQLDFPVIDGDGHSLEYMPVVLEYIRDFGGPKAVEYFTKRPVWFDMDAEARLRARSTRPPWWTYPTRSTIDHATSLLPALLEERLGEMGLDFTVLYPTRGIRATDIEDPDVRLPACRALNVYQSEVFGPHAA